MKLQTRVALISFKIDSTGARWNCEIPAGNNPFTRLLRYNQAVEISKNMKAVLMNLKNLCIESAKCVWDFHFQDLDSGHQYAFDKVYQPTYPTTEEIYSNFDVIKKSIRKQNGRDIRLSDDEYQETGNRQLRNPGGHTNKNLLKNDGKIFYRKMVPGNFLCAIVTGGPYTVNESMKQLNYFLKDNNKTQIANPFQVLITDRISEPDTLKWITRIYIPVVE